MNFNELQAEVAKYPNSVKLHPNFLFRGQADIDWKLTPAFTRIAERNSLSAIEALQLEREIVNRFTISANNLLPIEQTIALAHARLKSPDGHGIDFMGWLTVMQHFSAPTRLLDWTTSVWVAMYFACAENTECDGAIYVVDFDKVTQCCELKLNGANFNQLMFDPDSADVVVPIMAFNSLLSKTEPINTRKRPSFPRRRESMKPATWIPTFVGMTELFNDINRCILQFLVFWTTVLSTQMNE